MIRVLHRLPLRLVSLMTMIVLFVGVGTSALTKPVDAQADVPAVTFTVNSTDDFPDLLLNGVCATAFGTCTLRAAIQEVNNYGFASGPHNIHFNIAGAGPHTIQVYSVLPRLERAVVIDGTTDGGSCPTSSVPANIKIVIDGTPAGIAFSHGLDLWRNASAPSGSTIRGIAIGGFGYGVWLDGDGHTVECSHIGVNADGVTSLQNEEAGVMVWQGSNNTVGGSSYADRNVISGNSPGGDGIVVDNASSTTIQGNYIGTSSAGTLDVGNNAGVRVVESANTVVIGGTGSAQRNLLSGNVYGIVVDGNDVDVVNNSIGTHVSGSSALGNSYGIHVWENATNLTIGGGLVSEGNLISGNSSHGIFIDEADGVTILNNKIGVQQNGSSALGNGGKGVFLDGNVNNTRVGQPNDGNTIAFNDAGIWHDYCCGYQGFSTNGNYFRANSIHDNTDLGIDLTSNASGGVTLNDGAGDADNGPNEYQNYPGLIYARNSGYMYGLLVTRGSIDYTVDFYENETCDDSGYGEGETYLGSINVTTDALGYGTIDTTLSNAPTLGNYVVTTATASDDSTSEFSLCTLVTQATFEINSTADTADQAPGDGQCDISGASTDCTLRAAIQEVNALGGGPYVIEFDLGSGGGTVRPASALPNITVPVVIDAVTAQDGAYCGSDTGPAVLNVVLKGDLTTNVDGLHLATGSNGSSIKGLVINEFDGHGIRVSSNNNDITCNFIGVTSGGGTAAPNGLDGVHVTGVNSRIGGDGKELRNVLSGNLESGVEIAGSAATGNFIQGNIIGLGVAGAAAVANGASGVEIDGGLDNTVGGNSAGKRNIISGNGQHGVYIHSSGSSNKVRGNYIGTNEAGTIARGNTNSGVIIDNAASNTVGGTNANYGNLIAGNNGHGVLVQGGASDNTIRYNTIGLSSGAASLPNSGAGVRFNISTDNHVTDNTIKFNGQGGVIVLSGGQMNRIRTNSINQNTGLGIDLNNNGVTPNDGPGDPDTGANGLQNFPIITAANAGTGSVNGTLESAGNTEFKIDLFRSQQCDASGYGEGDVFLATYTGTTNGAGVLNFAQAVTGLTTGDYVTVTAMDPAGNSSEFSPCVAATCPDPDVDNDNDVDVTDITLVANRWNNPGSYDPAYDLDCSSDIDMLDIMLVAAAFGT